MKKPRRDRIGDLDPAGRAAVEAIIRAHPDLGSRRMVVAVEREAGLRFHCGPLNRLVLRVRNPDDPARPWHTPKVGEWAYRRIKASGFSLPEFPDAPDHHHVQARIAAVRAKKLAHAVAARPKDLRSQERVGKPGRYIPDHRGVTDEAMAVANWSNNELL